MCGCRAYTVGPPYRFVLHFVEKFGHSHEGSYKSFQSVQLSVLFNNTQMWLDRQAVSRLATCCTTARNMPSDRTVGVALGQSRRPSLMYVHGTSVSHDVAWSLYPQSGKDQTGWEPELQLHGGLRSIMSQNSKKTLTLHHTTPCER